MSEKNAHIEKLQAELGVLEADLNRLKARGKSAKADLKIEIERQHQALETKRQQFQSRLADLNQSGTEAWQTMKQGLDTAWTDLKQACEKAKAKFQD